MERSTYRDLRETIQNEGNHKAEKGKRDDDSKGDEDDGGKDGIGILQLFVVKLVCKERLTC